MPQENDWLTIVWAIVCIVVVLGMAYWVTRFLAGKGRLKGGFGRSGLGRSGNGWIRVVEQHALGRDQRLVVVQVKEKYYLLGITANSISMLSEVPGDPAKGLDEELLEQAVKERPTFREAFFDALRQRKRR